MVSLVWDRSGQPAVAGPFGPQGQDLGGSPVDISSMGSSGADRALDWGAMGPQTGTGGQEEGLQ